MKPAEALFLQKANYTCCSDALYLSQEVAKRGVQSVGVPADHQAGDRLGEGDVVADRGHPTAADLSHGVLLQHLRPSQRTLRGLNL